MQVTIRVRMSAHDAHYGGGLVDGARMLNLFCDVATELLIRHDGDGDLAMHLQHMASQAVQQAAADVHGISSLAQRHSNHRH